MMDLDFITGNAIVYVLAAWVIIWVGAKVLKLEDRGVKMKFYKLEYENQCIQGILTKILGRIRIGVRVLANVSVVASFLMMGFMFGIMLLNIINYFVEPRDFFEITPFVPGITMTSLDLVAFVLLSFPIVVVMHEGAHGIVATLERIQVKAGGVVVFLTKISGFADMDKSDFDKAKKISVLRVIGSGATSEMIFALVLGLILLTNPMFALLMPEPLLSTFYEMPEGVMILSVVEGSGAESAGLLANDIITTVGDVRLLSPDSFMDFEMVPGQIVPVDVLRDGKSMKFDVKIAEEPSGVSDTGMIGIVPDNSFSYKPVLGYIVWDNHHVFMFLLLLWMVAFIGGMMNVVPLPSSDGDRFIRTIIEGKISKRAVTVIMYGMYAFTYILIVLNVALSYIKVGWFTIETSNWFSQFFNPPL